MPKFSKKGQVFLGIFWAPIGEPFPTDTETTDTLQTGLHLGCACLAGAMFLQL